MTEQLAAAKSSLAERWVEPAFQSHARHAYGCGSEVTTSTFLVEAGLFSVVSLSLPSTLLNLDCVHSFKRLAIHIIVAARVAMGLWQ